MANVTFFPEEKIGVIKRMNAVNNGPVRPMASGQTRSNFLDYKALRIPYARIHDANHTPAYGGPHIVDVNAIFPNFDADENDPASYDFTCTDHYLQAIVDAGTQVFYRLGASIEHWVKKYNTRKPADFEKWTRISEHIILHYNEGWADGFRWGIEYWEIWNEPDLNGDDDKNKLCWGGTKAEFFEFFRIAATGLKKRFPHLKIGGPALAWNRQWEADFLAAMAKANVPLDFYSWHNYNVNPRNIGALCDVVRQQLDKNGYTKTESINNEYNYVRGWTDDWVYSLEQMTGIKGAVFTAACMCVCQDAPLDMLMYYDARVGCGMNGLFDAITLKRKKGFYPFYIFADLVEKKNQVRAESDDPEVYTLAARGDDGKTGLMLCYYTDDDNAGQKRISIETGLGDAGLDIRLVNEDFSFEPVWPQSREGGKLTFQLPKNSILYITAE